MDCFVASNCIELFDSRLHIMAQLAHPAIARVFEAGRFESDLGSQPYLAMELVLKAQKNAQRLNIKL